MGRYEKRRWAPHDAERYTPHAGRRNRRAGTYDAYIPDLLTGWEPSLPLRLAGEVAEAETQVRLTDAAPSADDPSAAEWLLVRAESVASSRIEGVFPSLRRIARAEARQAGLNATRQDGNREYHRHGASPDAGNRRGGRSRSMIYAGSIEP